MFLPSSVLTHKTGGSGGFVPNGLGFGSGGNYLQNTSLSGTPDGFVGSLSFWVQFAGGDGIPYQIKYNALQNTYVRVFRGSSNFLEFRVINFSTGHYFDAVATVTTTGVGWHNVLMSWDTNHSAGNKIGYIYVDGSSTSPVLTDASAAFSVSYSLDNFITPYNASNNNINLAEIWYAPNQFIDFSVSGNRAKFYSSGNAVNLGSDGSTPTGTPPAVYIHNPAATCNTNLGTGGDFAIVGSIIDVSPPP